MNLPRLGGPKYLPGVGVRGRARRAFSMLRVRPSICSPCRPSLAASAWSEVTILTKPKPRDSLVCGSRMIWHFSTSPYFSKRRVTSDSVRRGWTPVTNRLDPGLTAPSSSPPLEAVSSLVPLWGQEDVLAYIHDRKQRQGGFAYRSPLPEGEAERRRPESPSSRRGRGEALRLSRS